MVTRSALAGFTLLCWVACTSETPTPTPTADPTPTPPVEPTPTPTAGPIPTPTPTPTPTASPTPAPTATPTPFPATAEQAETLRLLAFAYWEAFNSYDPDRTLSYLEGDYRAKRESESQSEIGQIKRFRVKLGISEESAPQMTRADEAEMYLKMRAPLGARRIRMAFRMVEDSWKITYAEEVK